MTKLIQPAAVVAVLLVGASSAMTAPLIRAHSPAQITHNPTWTDMSKPYGGYDPNSPEGNRAFWNYRARQGGR